MCEECDKEFLESYMLKKFNKYVCDNCKLVPSICFIVDITHHKVLCADYCATEWPLFAAV